MNALLTKSQKQELGTAITSAGFADALEFVYDEELEDEESYGSATLTCRDSSDVFTITPTNTGYAIRASIPGTSRQTRLGGLGWDRVVADFYEWAADVKRENEAVDPWQQEAEDMAKDDSYFTVNELPRVDKAIEESLDVLKELAIDHGLKLEQIEDDLQETKKLLEKSARSSTKKEWISLFRSIVLGKLADWGMKTALFQTVLQTLITSAHEVAQLADHAARHLIN